MTQDDLSHAAGIDRSYLSQLERDLKSPTIQILFRLCRPLKVLPSELMAKLEQQSPAPKSRRSETKPR